MPKSPVFDLDVRVYREGSHPSKPEQEGFLYRAYHTVYQTGETGVFVDICFDELRIVKTTPKGVWVAESHDIDQKPWKWISLSGKKRYAYPTKMEAMQSYLARKERHIRCLEDKVEGMAFAIGLLKQKIAKEI